MDQFGLVFEFLHARRHGIVHSSITSFIENFTSGVFGLSGVLPDILKRRGDSLYSKTNAPSRHIDPTKRPSSILFNAFSIC